MLRMIANLLSPAAILRAVLLFGLVAVIYGDGFFRIPGIEKGDGGVGLLLSAARGIVIYGGRFAVWPALFVYFVVRERRITRMHWSSLLPVVLFMSYVTLSAVFFGVPEVVVWRGSYFVTTVLPASACMLMCIDRRSAEAIPRWLVGAAGVAVGIIIVSGKLMPILLADSEALDAITGSVSSVSAPGRLVLQSDPITSASIFFIAALAGLFLMRDTKGWGARLALLVIVALSIWFGLLSGARGPLLSFIVSVIVLYGFSRLRLGRKFAGLMGGAGIVVAGFWLLPYVSEVSAARVFGLLGSVDSRLDIYGSSDAARDGSGRRDLYEAALSAPVTVFGRGIGSFGRDRGEVTGYAHNLFLEAHYEMGVVGIAAIAAICFSCLVRLLGLARRGSRSALFCLVALSFYFIQSQFSGTLLMNTGLWVFLVLGHMVFAVERTGPRIRESPTVAVVHASTRPAGFQASESYPVNRAGPARGTGL